MCNILGSDGDENYDYSDAIYFVIEKQEFVRDSLVFMF
jgi:hypothetical protein